jgi:hypothetical protein
MSFSGVKKVIRIYGVIYIAIIPVIVKDNPTNYIVFNE